MGFVGDCLVHKKDCQLRTFVPSMLPMSQRNGGPKDQSQRAAQRIANMASNMRTVQTNDNTKCLGPDFQPGPFDVICARGKTAFHHSGNQRFRALIENRVEAYASAANKFEKSVIVSQIVDEIRLASPSGGFIRSDNGVWYEVGDAAREKVGQSFRDLLHSKYRSSTKAKKLRKQVSGSFSDGQERGVGPLKTGSDGVRQSPSPAEAKSSHPSSAFVADKGDDVKPAAMSRSSHSQQGMEDMEPISFHTAMALPPYPDFLAPRQPSYSGLGAMGTSLQQPDMTYVLQMLQSSQSEEPDTCDSPQDQQTDHRR